MSVSFRVEVCEDEAGFLVLDGNCWQYYDERKGTQGVPEDRDLIDDTK